MFDALWAGEGGDVDALIDAKGLRQMSDAGALEQIVDEVIAANAKSVEEFRAGKDKAFNALVGQAMKASRARPIRPRSARCCARSSADAGRGYWLGGLQRGRRRRGRRWRDGGLRRRQRTERAGLGAGPELLAAAPARRRRAR